jgi:hypothetical protein
MGAWGALLQGMRHPDRYGFIALVSPPVFDVMDPVLRPFLEAAGVLRDQGYGTAATHEAWWRNFNPREIASNLIGTGTRVLIVYGDGCMPDDSARSPNCQRYSTVQNPLANLVIEAIIINRQAGLAMSTLARNGVLVASVELAGGHGALNAEAYEEYVVPAANESFSTAIPAPQAFSFRTAESSFSVWGYDVTIDRDNVEFLGLGPANIDGRMFQISGSGTVDVLTPTMVSPGARCRVILSSPVGKRRELEVTANASGRVGVQVTLARSNPVDEGSLRDTIGSPVGVVTVRVLPSRG